MTFGPNALPEYHHRERRAEDLLGALIDRVTALPGCADYDPLFLTGSGTLGLEAVAYSLRAPLRVPRADLSFGKRLEAVMAAHGNLSLDKSGPSARVHYETSDAQLMRDMPRDLVLADCVSAFPYYAPPPGVPIWVTVSGKQLRAPAGIAIVMIHRERGWPLLRAADSAYSYLNLTRYREIYERRLQCPHTPSLALFESLLESLEGLDVAQLRRTCDERRELLVSAFGDRRVGGEGPVAVLHGVPDALGRQMGLYPGVGGWQAFLTSGEDADYERLAAALAYTVPMLRDSQASVG